jgi:2-polyprenyl-3-methyl-5-hydroxy-6-metoxy-1,4-benzoquinol methylase
MDIWNKHYKNIAIKADYRVHDKILELLNKISLRQGDLLDIACGEGALAQRIIDENPNLNVDVNDINSNSIFCQGYKNKYGVDLNKQDFEFPKQYDVIIAVEIIEHIENPWNFMRAIRRALKPEGVILLSTPNIDSIFDRIFFLIYGYHFYFGERGIVHSGGHITMVPMWLINHMCLSSRMKIINQYYVDTTPHHGLRYQILKLFLSQILILAKNRNDASINILQINSINQEGV